jgi:adenosine deaminase
MSVQELVRAMPKAELHAHLSGSLSPETIQELVQLHKETFPDEALPPEADRFKDITDENKSFDSTFAIFRVAQAIVDHPAAVSIAVKRVIQEFFDDNVVYLELRFKWKQN